MNSLNESALLALAVMDLTRLEDDDSESAIIELCRRAHTPFGCPAAVCVYPRYLPVARHTLAELGLTGRVKVATVVNFPSGQSDSITAARETAEAVNAGCDEIDAVFPYRAFLGGDENRGREQVAACREAAGDRCLKIILETGELAEEPVIRRAAELAIAGGADFLKTSTGKVPVNATPEAARVLLESIRDSGRQVGCKVSGGIRTTTDAITYLQLATEVMGPDWVSPGHFRIGASGLLDDLLACLQTTHKLAR